MDINTQPTEPQVLDKHIEIVKIWQTIQGEGPFAGERAVFVRMAGCNLQCPFCDTDYTFGRTAMDPVQFYDEIHRCSITSGSAADVPNINLVVFTGGEPFRQTSLALFTMGLLHRGFRVQVETNGTLNLALSTGVKIVCSPKTPHLHPAMIKKIDVLKYVIESGHVDGDGLPGRVLGRHRPARIPNFGGEIWVQPMDEQDVTRNQLHIKAAVESVVKHGHRLCLQLHKYIGME